VPARSEEFPSVRLSTAFIIGRDSISSVNLLATVRVPTVESGKYIVAPVIDLHSNVGQYNLESSILV
jgi:hypothetical protein